VASITKKKDGAREWVLFELLATELREPINAFAAIN